METKTSWSIASKQERRNVEIVENENAEKEEEEWGGPCLINIGDNAW